MAPYKDILLETDLELICKLGVLLQLAIALDVSETQAIEVMTAFTEGTTLHLKVRTKHDPSAEYREVEGQQKDFKKAWGIQLNLHELSFSKN